MNHRDDYLWDRSGDGDATTRLRPVRLLEPR